MQLLERRCLEPASTFPQIVWRRQLWLNAAAKYHWTLVGAPLISAANPDISADVNWASEFQSRLTRRGIARMVGRKDLNTRPNLGLVANADLDNIQDAWNGMALLA